MKTNQMKRVLCVATVLFMGVGLAGQVVALEQTDWIVLHPNLNSKLTRYEIPLTYEPGNSQLFRQSLEAKATVLKASEQTGGYTQRLDFDNMIDGRSYHIFVGPDEGLKILNRNDPLLIKLRMSRQSKSGPSETLGEGYYLTQRSLDLPIPIPKEALSIPATEDLDGQLQFQLNQLGLNQCQGRLTLSCQGQVTGSLLTDVAKMQVTLNYGDDYRSNFRNYDNRSQHRQISLAVWPYDDKSRYESAHAELTDVLRLGTASVVVEKIARDSSRLILAVVHGSLEAAGLKSASLVVGQPVPSFARVDLVRRHMVTLSELREKAGKDGWIVMVFGDLNSMSQEMRYRYGRVSTSSPSLPLDPAQIQQTLHTENGHDPILVLVTRQFAVKDLYTRWLDKDPKYYLLSDTSNPEAALHIESPFNRPNPFNTDRSVETLRGQLVLPENKLSVLLINNKGQLDFIEPDTQGKLGQVLMQVKDMMQKP